MDDKKKTSVRKCIYTNLDARFTDLVIPRPLLGDEEIHNWCNKAPLSLEYKNKGKGHSTMPTELELEANDIFHKLELARLKVLFYQKKMKTIQQQIIKGETKLSNADEWDRKKALKKDKKPILTKTQQKKKDDNINKVRQKHYDRARHEVDEIQNAESMIEEGLKNNLWD